MIYDVIRTGSKGNGVIINDSILIDCGVPYKALGDKINGLKLVLLTHTHCDHFNANTVRNLAKNRPLLRFAGGEWMAASLLRAGVELNRIDVLEAGKGYIYRMNDDVTVMPVTLHHNVPNVGYKIFAGGERLFYATDTATLDGITAKNYDLYLIEANYDDEEIQKRIEKKRAAGQYCYEAGVTNRHLSKKQADNFIYANAGNKSQYAYLHCHEGLLFDD